MLKVYKYEIDVNDYFEIELPSGATVLKVDEQFGKPCLWALVNPESQKTKRTFRFAGTGHPIDDDKPLQFVNTFQMKGGALIFHIFEVLNN